MTILSRHSLEAYIGTGGPDDPSCPACEEGVDGEELDCSCVMCEEEPDPRCAFCGGGGVVIRCRACGQVR